MSVVSAKEKSAGHHRSKSPDQEAHKNSRPTLPYRERSAMLSFVLSRALRLRLVGFVETD